MYYVFAIYMQNIACPNSQLRSIAEITSDFHVRLPIYPFFFPRRSICCANLSKIFKGKMQLYMNYAHFVNYLKIYN